MPGTGRILGSKASASGRGRVKRRDRSSGLPDAEADRARPFHAVESKEICGANRGSRAGRPGSESGRLRLWTFGLARAERQPDLFAAPSREQPARRSIDRLRGRVEQDGRRGRQVFRYSVGEPALADDRNSAADGGDLAGTVGIRFSHRGGSIRGQPPDHPAARASFTSIPHRPVGFSSKWKSASSWKTWSSPTDSPRVVLCSPTISPSTGSVRSSVPSPLEWGGSTGDRDPNLEQAILAGVRDSLFL